MDKMLFIVWLVNLVFSVIYALTVLRRDGRLCYLIMFLAIPVLGFLIYLIPTLMTRKREAYTYDKESLVKRYQVEKQGSHLNVKKEMNVVPIKDAMAISSDGEKRTLLLEQLKKDLYTNYKAILIANNDRDSESAHYVASAKMEVNRKMKEELTQLQKQMTEHLSDAEIMYLYMNKLRKYIESGLLSSQEAAIYKKEYCSRFEDLDYENVQNDYAKLAQFYVTYLIELGETAQALAFWDAAKEEVRSEGMYMEILKLFYQQRDEKRFYETIDSLSASDIELTAKGLSTLRYWRNRR